MWWTERTVAIIMSKWDTGVALVRQNQGIRFATKEDWTRDIGLGAVIIDRFAAGWRFGFRSRDGLAGGEGGGSHSPVDTRTDGTAMDLSGSTNQSPEAMYMNGSFNRILQFNANYSRAVQDLALHRT